MKPQVNKKWRKKSPNRHKSYGEKRNRDVKKTVSQYFIDLVLYGDDD